LNSSVSEYVGFLGLKFVQVFIKKFKKDGGRGLMEIFINRLDYSE